MVQSSRRIPSHESGSIVARPRTSYWTVGAHRIRAGVSEIDAIMAVEQSSFVNIICIICVLYEYGPVGRYIEIAVQARSRLGVGCRALPLSLAQSGGI